MQMLNPDERDVNGNKLQPYQKFLTTIWTPWHMKKGFYLTRHTKRQKNNYNSKLPWPSDSEFCNENPKTSLDAKAWLEEVAAPVSEGTPLAHLYTRLKRYRCVWHGHLEYINYQTAVRMFFVSGMRSMAECSLPERRRDHTPLVRMFRKMKLEPSELERVAKMIQTKRYCTLLALPCHYPHTDTLLTSSHPVRLIAHLQQKQEAGIVYVRAADKPQPLIHTMYIFPSCDFVNENLRLVAPHLLEHLANQEYLLIVFIRARKMIPGTKLKIATHPESDLQGVSHIMVNSAMTGYLPRRMISSLRNSGGYWP